MTLATEPPATLVCASPVTVLVHDGDNCRSHAPACCPLLGSDYYTLVPPDFLASRCPTFCVASRCFAIGVARVQPAATSTGRSCRNAGRIVLRDAVILAAHAPAQRRSHRRRQPSWWNADCSAAGVARNGAFRDTTGCVLRSRTCVSAQLDNSSIAQCVEPDGPPHFQLATHRVPHRQFDALSNADSSQVEQGAVA